MRKTRYQAELPITLLGVGAGDAARTPGSIRLPVPVAA
jgi:hypothetical protein